MKRRILIVALGLALTLLSACGGEGKVNAPFEDSYCKGKDVNEIVDLLENAGFTNIELQAVETSSAWNEDAVISIKIGSNMMFNTANAWKPDVKIAIKYYELSEETKQKEEERQAKEAEKAEAELDDIEDTVPEFIPENYAADTDSIRQLAKDLFAFGYSDLQVTWDDFDSAFAVSYLPDTVLNETAYVIQNINRYIHFCKHAYQIDGVDRVRFDVLLAGMDQYGNDMVIEGLSEIMTRETFEKFNWGNLEYLPIWDTFVDNCYYFGTAPVLNEKIDTDKVFYDPFMRDGKIT